MMQAVLFKLATPMRVIGAVFFLAAAALFIAGAGSPKLYVFDFPGGSVEIGLFRYCVGSDCANIDKDCSSTYNGVTQKLDHCDTFNAGRAFAVMGLLLIAIAAILAFVNLCKKSAVGTAATVLAFVATVVCGIIAMAIVYQYKKDNSDMLDGYSYGSSAALLVAAWVIGFIGALLHLFGCKGSDLNPIA